jgi:hypothetical protein
MNNGIWGLSSLKPCMFVSSIDIADCIAPFTSSTDQKDGRTQTLGFRKPIYDSKWGSWSRDGEIPLLTATRQPMPNAVEPQNGTRSSFNPNTFTPKWRNGSQTQLSGLDFDQTPAVDHYAPTGAARNFQYGYDTPPSSRDSDLYPSKLERSTLGHFDPAVGVGRLSLTPNGSAQNSRRPSGYGLLTQPTRVSEKLDFNGLRVNTLQTSPLKLDKSPNPRVEPFYPGSTPPDSAYSSGWQDQLPFNRSQTHGYEPQQIDMLPYRGFQPLPSQLYNPQMQMQFQLHQLQMQQMQMHFQMYPFMALPIVPQVQPPPKQVQTPVTDLMSQKIKDFHQSYKYRKWELSEFYGHLVEFAGDQLGSRFLQSVMSQASTQDKAQIFDELYPNALPLMQDVFGNYVIQKFFEHGDQMQKRMLGNLMVNQVQAFTFNMYGCRVVQKAFEHVLADQRAILVQELNKPGLIMECVKDQHGNHVIQKAIEVIPSHVIPFIYDRLLGEIPFLSEHNYGCRVVQRMLEQTDVRIQQIVLAKLRESGERLITSTYGNYVAQHIVSKGDPPHKIWMKGLVFRDIRGYSQDKFASNVVEVCIQEGSTDERRTIMNAIMKDEDGILLGDSGTVRFIKCSYGNYVVRKYICLPLKLSDHCRKAD